MGNKQDKPGLLIQKNKYDLMEMEWSGMGHILEWKTYKMGPMVGI